MSEIRKGPACGGAGERSEQVQGHPARNEAEIERMRDQLADLLFPEDDGEIDEEALDALLDRLEEVSPLPASLSTDPEEALERFRRRYAPLLMETGAGGTSRETSAAPRKRHCSKKPFVKALPFAAALILLFGTVTAQAFGVDVFSAIARWTAEVFRLDGGSTPYAAVRLHPLEVGEEASYESLEEAMAAFGIDAPIVPKEIPEGFEMVEVRAVQWKIGLSIYADYKSEDGFFQVRYREAPNPDFNTLEKEQENVNIYIIKNIEHYLMVDLGRQKAVWQNGDFECRVSGSVTEQEMKKMIDSIYEE